MRHRYICDTCGKEDFWGPTWLHYSSLKELEDAPEKIKTWCSIDCAASYNNKKWSAKRKTEILKQLKELKPNEKL